MKLSGFPQRDLQSKEDEIRKRDLDIAAGIHVRLCHSYQGRKIDSEKVKEPPPGIVGVEEGTELFGKPDQAEKPSFGVENYIYQYGRDIPHWWTIDSMSQSLIL
jgi:hypothetical protein